MINPAGIHQQGSAAVFADLLRELKSHCDPLDSTDTGPEAHRSTALAFVMP